MRSKSAWVRALAVAIGLLSIGCGLPKEEGAAGGDSQESVAALAELEGYPLGFLVQHRGKQLFEVVRHTDLYPRVQALLGSSLPRILSNGQNLTLIGSHLVALPHPKAESWCNAAVFWADLPNDRLHVRIPIGGVLRSFDEGPPDSPPAEVVAAIEEFGERLPNACGEPEFVASTAPASSGCSSIYGLSPEKVYVRGTLRPGHAGYDALFDPAEPHRYMVGFPEQSGTAQLKPDGSLVYSSGESLRLFVPDSQERDRGDGPRRRFVGGPGCVYPETPEANDIVLETPGCQEPLYPGRFWLRAGDGAVIYDCSQGERSHYFVVGGEALKLEANRPLAFGGRQTALLEEGSALSIADTSGAAPPIRVELPKGLGPEGPVRTTADGYLIALINGFDNKPPPSLWRISFSGQISRVADYAPPPADLRFASGSWTSGRLAPDGTLWVMSAGGLYNSVVAMRPGGESSVVLREQSFPEPVVSLFMSSLVATP